jgi:uncharacterized protein
MTQTSQGFDRLAAALADAGSPVELAELHGALCGVLCSAGPEAARAWLDECLSDCEPGPADEEDFHAPFHALRQQSWEALSAAGMDFSPLLPDDDEALPQRVQALASWCHGFLTGLGLGGLKLGDDEPGNSEELAEIVRDFVEISRADFEPESESDAASAEFAFADLAEFVRVGVQIVFEEIGRRPQPGDGQRIH